MKTSYEEIINCAIGDKIDLNTALTLAQQERLNPSSRDPVQRLLLVIDEQIDFMDDGALGVPGAYDDSERLCKFIYVNMNGITRIIASQDTHKTFQIFHPCWWNDKNGKEPNPYIDITYDDIKNGIWIPIIKPADSLDYIQNLEALGKKKLKIWPYHCLDGSPGQALEPRFATMMYFHSIAKRAQNTVIHKGQDPLSEMYGIIKPEYSKKNFINTKVLNELEKYEVIFIAGEAASHCLLETVKQICEHFANRPEILQRIVILIDCTSPIPGCEDATKREFEYFEKTYGIKFAKSTDILVA